MRLNLNKKLIAPIALASLGCVGYLGKFYFSGGKNTYTPDMTGKTVVITGGNSGKLSLRK